jgi:hypothetical protein
MATSTKYPSTLSGVTRWAFARRSNLRRLLSARDPVALVNPHLKKALRASDAKKLRRLLRRRPRPTLQSVPNERDVLTIAYALWRLIGPTKQSELGISIPFPWKQSDWNMYP